MAGPPAQLRDFKARHYLGAKAVDRVAHNEYLYTSMNSRDVISALKADGWREVAQKGSHVQFKHPAKPGRVTVVHPERDIPKGTLGSIERQAGLILR